jgi:hypothetical protein
MIDSHEMKVAVQNYMLNAFALEIANKLEEASLESLDGSILWTEERSRVYADWSAKELTAWTPILREALQNYAVEREKSAWIKCTARLPDVDDYVWWLYANGAMIHACIDQDMDDASIKDFLKGWEHSGPITHWRKAPALPEEDEFDIACLRAPCDPGDALGVMQLISRSRCAADQIEALIIQRDALLTVMKELRASAEYWSEYDVPVGIVERMDQAIKIAEENI